MKGLNAVFGSLDLFRWSGRDRCAGRPLADQPELLLLAAVDSETRTQHGLISYTHPLPCFLCLTGFTRLIKAGEFLTTCRYGSGKGTEALKIFSQKNHLMKCV